MKSFSEFLGISITEQEDANSIYAAPDKAKAITIMNQAISQLPTIINNLKDLGTKLESASLNSSKVKNAAESLEKYMEALKKEASV
jgi:hypothetical protein